MGTVENEGSVSRGDFATKRLEILSKEWRSGRNGRIGVGRVRRRCAALVNLHDMQPILCNKCYYHELTRFQITVCVKPVLLENMIKTGIFNEMTMKIGTVNKNW